MKITVFGKTIDLYDEDLCKAYEKEYAGILDEVEVDSLLSESVEHSVSVEELVNTHTEEELAEMAMREMKRYFEVDANAKRILEEKGVIF